MKPGHRAPITQEERDAMRQRRLEGKSLEEIALEFSCSRASAQKTCANLVERTFQIGKPISQEKIDQIIAYRKEGRTQPDIARIVGVSTNVVTRYTPPELKICRPRGGEKRERVRWSPERPVGAIGQARWDKAETKKLCDMMKEGSALREIAIELKRSYTSVKDKVGRMAKATKVVPPPEVPEIEFEEKPRFAMAKCLKCLKQFESYDPRKNRICARCKSNEGWS
jgi:DNA-binding CsgD family transcriptional regulator